MPLLLTPFLQTLIGGILAITGAIVGSLITGYFLIKSYEKAEIEKKKLEDSNLYSPTDVIIGHIGKQLVAGIETIERKALPKITGWISEFADQYHISKVEVERMNQLAASGEFGLNAVVSFILGVTVQPAISVATAPAWEAAGQQVWNTLPVRLMDVSTLVRLKYKNLIKDDYFDSQLGKQGFNKEAIQGFIDDYKFLPTPGDVIRWAVREAFYEDYVKKYGLDAEYPGKLEEYGAKLGMASTELHYFWRSHWELPSTYQGFEMLHRNIITSEDLDKLFMANDIMPFWRDKLMGISYKPYTRVDIRRMFKGGNLDKEGVMRGYLDGGYDEEHATNLTNWTVGDVMAKERDLTRATIENLYKEGQIRREEAAQYLIGLRYDEDEAEYMLILVDLKLADELEKELIRLWTEQFKLNEIDIKGFESNLGTLTITVDKRARLVAKAKRVELSFITKPPKGDLITWFSNDIITGDKFKEEMRGLGYSENAIGNYVKMAALGGE